MIYHPKNHPAMGEICTYLHFESKRPTPRRWYKECQIIDDPLKAITELLTTYKDSKTLMKEMKKVEKE